MFLSYPDDLVAEVAPLWIELFLSVEPLTVPLVVAPAGLRWFDCILLGTVPDGRATEEPEPVVTAGRGAVAEPALLTLPDEGVFNVPAGLLPAVALSLIEGVVLTTVDLFAVLPFVAVPLVADVTLVGVVLPAAASALVLVLPAIVLFLLTVLLLPMPPLREVLLLNTLSEPVSCLEPYHTSLPYP